MYVASIFGYYEYIEINAFITGAVAIGIISGAYSTEVFRGAIQSIDKGQFEAAKVLGISKFGQFYKIILPQMLRLAIPNLSNVWQITLKDTSLISVTGLVEIMRQSYIAAGSTRDPLFFYSFAAVLYLMLTYISMKLINKLERNRSIMINPKGEIAVYYDKIKMFNVRLPNKEKHNESSTYKSGNKLVSVKLPWGNLGLTICYDLRFPEIYRNLSKKKLSFISVPSAFTKITGQKHWLTLFKSKSNRKFLLYFRAKSGRKKYKKEKHLAILLLFLLMVKYLK